MNGGPPQTGEHMLNVGTYNALLEPNEFYCPMRSTFDASHKTFKRMMPTFAWEVLEVYSGPPKVAFRWRHWGTMKEDYTGTNKWVSSSSLVGVILTSGCSKGESVTIKAHGGAIDIEGIVVAEVNDKLQLQKIDVWYDPMSMFRQMAPDGETGVTKVKADE